MGTRSAIGYMTPEGKVRAKYSHYDGYVSYTGAILQEHYQEARKIAQMVELGDQSGIAPEIYATEPGHSFATPQDGVTVFYGRDRGEDNVDAQEFDTVAEFVDYYAGAGCEYFYLRSNADWIVHDRYGVGKDALGHAVFDLVSVKLAAEA